LKRLIIMLFLVPLLWFSIHTVVIIIDGLNDEIKPTEVAVVLGNKVELTGQPSKRLQSRLDKAVKLYNRDQFQYVIVSGGIGKEGFDEAKVMKDYLIEQGVDRDVIILDSDGYNTFMTAENTKRIMDDMGLESVMVITQYHHITRTKLAFNKLGFENVYSASADFFEVRDLYSILREFFAFYKYLVK